MWFEVIPPMAIIFAGIAGPGYALWWTHYFVIGNHFRRGLNDRWSRALYQRDLRITGNPYVQNVFEGIPDLPEKKKK